MLYLGHNFMNNPGRIWTKSIQKQAILQLVTKRFLQVGICLRKLKLKKICSESGWASIRKPFFSILFTFL